MRKLLRRLREWLSPRSLAEDYAKMVAKRDGFKLDQDALTRDRKKWMGR